MKRTLYIAAAIILTAGAISAEKLNAWDKDEDGKMNLEEFCAQRKFFAKKAGKEYDEKTAKFIFRKKDKNKDGFVTKEENQAKAN